MSGTGLDEVVALAKKTVRTAYLNTTSEGKAAIEQFIMEQQAWRHRKPDAYALFCAVPVGVIAFALGAWLF